MTDVAWNFQNMLYQNRKKIEFIQCVFLVLFFRKWARRFFITQLKSLVTKTPFTLECFSSQMCKTTHFEANFRPSLSPPLLVVVIVRRFAAKCSRKTRGFFSRKNTTQSK